MGLFLMDHSITKIMLLGRWSSDAFLKYIRPQVVEWTNQLSRDMIHHNYFSTPPTLGATLRTTREPGAPVQQPPKQKATAYTYTTKF